MDCLQEMFEWHTWTGVKSVRVVCIRFLLQDIHQFESLRLSNMSNHLSCIHQHIVIKGMITNSD
jgi:hypothetical protein